MRSPASRTPGAPPKSLPSRPGLSGRRGEDRPIYRHEIIPGRRHRDGPSSRPGLPDRGSGTGYNCPMSESQFCETPSVKPRRASQNRKGMRPFLGCWPARAAEGFHAAREARGGPGERVSRGRCLPGSLGTPAPQAAPCGRASAAHPTRPCLTSRRAALTATPRVGSGPGRALQRVIKEPGEKAGPERPGLAWWPIRRRVGEPDGGLQRPRRGSRGRPRAARREGCRAACFPGSTRAGGAGGHRGPASFLSPRSSKQAVVKLK